MSTNNTTQVIPATLSTGKELPLRRTTSKNGVVGFAVLKPGKDKQSGFGVRVSHNVVGNELPESITVLGTTFPLVRDTDPERKNTSVVIADGATVNVPGLGKRAIDGRITLVDRDEQGNPIFNVKVSLHGISGGGAKHVLDEL